MVTYGNRNSHLFPAFEWFHLPDTPFIPPEVHTHRQFSLVILRFSGSVFNKIQISFPCHIGWKFDRMPAHHRCIPIQSGKFTPLTRLTIFPPTSTGLSHDTKTEARYGLRYKRAGHPLLIQRDPSSIVEIIRLIYNPNDTGR